ncbi:MAG TPA: carboxylating nicotinate-nucleotide diphosphorylase [Clostridiales bacterium]|nr:carboxylating nicotinate-nucleotide diphosphorylase [Clostridiales bacterium]
MTNLYIDQIIKTALNEDINFLDITTDYLIEETSVSTADFLAKSDGILCGIDIALRVLKLLDSNIEFEKHKNDGDEIKKGDIIAQVRGNTRSILKGERTALNFVQHLSGVATATHKAVKLVEGTKAVIADTRKPLPGLRVLQKYAVVCGGGKNHRFNLSDAAMIKDNHIDACGGIARAVEKLREKAGHMVKIEVETRNLDEVREALKAGADVIMLDNMDCETMRQAVEIVGSRALVEASGGITDESLREVAETGVDIISIGALTHSVKALDISLKISRKFV